MYCAHRYIVDPHAAQCSPVVAEVILYGRICHLREKKGMKKKKRNAF